TRVRKAIRQVTGYTGRVMTRENAATYTGTADRTVPSPMSGWATYSSRMSRMFWLYPSTESARFGWEREWDFESHRPGSVTRPRIGRNTGNPETKDNSHPWTVANCFRWNQVSPSHPG